jgi:hypothetical protein
MDPLKTASWFQHLWTHNFLNFHNLLKRLSSTLKINFHIWKSLQNFSALLIFYNWKKQKNKKWNLFLVNRHIPWKFCSNWMKKVVPILKGLRKSKDGAHKCNYEYQKSLLKKALLMFNQCEMVWENHKPTKS